MAGTDDDRLAEIRARLDNRLGYSRPYDGGPVHQPNEAMLIHEDVPYLLDRLAQAEAHWRTWAEDEVRIKSAAAEARIAELEARIRTDRGDLNLAHLEAEAAERRAEAERARLVAALTPLVEAAQAMLEPRRWDGGPGFNGPMEWEDSHDWYIDREGPLRTAIETAAAVLQEMAPAEETAGR